MITRVPGTQDILDMTTFVALADALRHHLCRAGFHEIATPLIEPTELFQRSLGNETDVISKELYYVASGHAAGDEVRELCLRPEATASAMRAYLNNSIQDRPWNLFTIGPMFRHERQQKGRYRQFHQASIEIINTDSIAQDVRLISLLDRFFADVLNVRSYALLINFMGCRVDREKFLERLIPFLQEHREQLCSSCVRRSQTNVVRVLDCKEEACQALYARGPQLTDSLCVECVDEWQRLRVDLELLGISYAHQPRLVRGLDYYEKTVFEFVSMQLGAQNAFCGGGRYSRIAQEIGAAQDVPAVGAAIGMERLLMLWEGAPISIAPLHLVLPLSKEQRSLALQIADLLHVEGFCVEPLLEESSLKSMLRLAHKRGARTCLLIGSQEQESGTVMVKQMLTGVEQRVAQREVVAYVKGV